MSDPAPEDTRSSQHVPGGRRRRSLGALAVLLPAVTLLVGLLIGYAVWGGAPGADRGGAADGSAPTANETASPETQVDDRTVTVPSECLRAVDESEAVLTMVEEAVAAAGDLDAARLQQVLDGLQGVTERVRALGEECRARADVSRASGSATPAD